MKGGIIRLPAAAAAAKSLQLCLTLCDPIDSSLQGSSVPRILQARILQWVAISFSNTWKWKVKVKSLSCVQLYATPWTAAYQAPLSMGVSRQEYWSGLPLPSPIRLPTSHICWWIEFTCTELLWKHPAHRKHCLNVCHYYYKHLIQVTIILGFPVAEWVSNPLATEEIQEMWVWSLVQKDPLKEKMATHSFILAWKIPWTEEPGRVQSKMSQS